jgi:hypothetical protein
MTLTLNGLYAELQQIKMGSEALADVQDSMQNRIWNEEYSFKLSAQFEEMVKDVIKPMLSRRSYDEPKAPQASDLLLRQQEFEKNTIIALKKELEDFRNERGTKQQFDKLREKISVCSNVVEQITEKYENIPNLVKTIAQSEVQSASRHFNFQSTQQAPAYDNETLSKIQYHMQKYDGEIERLNNEYRDVNNSLIANAKIRRAIDNQLEEISQLQLERKLPDLEQTINRVVTEHNQTVQVLREINNRIDHLNAQLFRYRDEQSKQPAVDLDPVKFHLDERHDIFRAEIDKEMKQQNLMILSAKSDLEQRYKAIETKLDKVGVGDIVRNTYIDKTTIILSFLSTMEAFFEPILDDVRRGIWSLMREKVYRILDSHTSLSAEHICTALLSIGIIDKHMHFDKFIARILAIVYWYNAGQMWYEDDPHHQYCPYVTAEGSDDLNELIHFGMSIEETLYILEQKVEVAESKQKDIWNSILHPALVVDMWKSPVIRSIFIAVQDILFPANEGQHFRVICFIAGLTQWIMKHTTDSGDQVIFSIERPQEILIHETFRSFPELAIQWEQLSAIRQWYYVTVTRCWILEGSIQGSGKIAFNPNPNIDYLTELTNCGLIKIRTGWRNVLADMFPSPQDYEQQLIQIKQLLGIEYSGDYNNGELIIPKAYRRRFL